MVFPHAIAQGASWDPALIRRMSNVTAVEVRISSAISYQGSGTDHGVDLSCDGGPLANSAHDPRWGRISETYALSLCTTAHQLHTRFTNVFSTSISEAITRPNLGYGEDPAHIQTMGVSAMRGMQSPQPVPGGKPEDVFFATRQVTRHSIGYHGASLDIAAARGASERAILSPASAR
jgi:beta-glucosidase-like glycosyl hydrolase